MSTTETYPHVIPAESYADCACGVVHPMARGRSVGETWGSGCPAALRERVAELERATHGPHISPALMRRVEALGFTPGDANPVTWLVHHAEELAATLANERGEGEPPVAGFEWSPPVDDRLAHDGTWGGLFDNMRIHVSPSGDEWLWEVMSRQVCPVTIFAAGRAPYARVAMRDAFAARGAK